MEYFRLAPNFHIISKPIDKFGVKYQFNFTAGGAFYEKKGKKGLSHLLEHCIVARTKELDFDDLKQYLFQNNIYRNASTSRVDMGIIVSGHKNDSEALLDLILNFAFKPCLTKDILKREKEIVLREISQYAGDTNYRLNKVLIDKVFEEGSLQKCEVLGEIEDVRNATTKSLESVLRNIYKKSHFVISAVGGGVDIELIKSKLMPLIDKFPSDEILPLDYEPKSIIKKFDYLPVVHELAHEHAILNIVIPCPVTLENRSTRAFIRELLLESQIGYIYDKLRNQLGYIYSLNYFFDKNSQILTLVLACELSHLKEIVSEIKAAFGKFDEVFSPQKLKIIRDLIIKRRELNEDDPEFTTDFTLGILSDFGVLMQYEDYIKLLEQTDERNIKDLYSTLENNLEKMQIVVVSNKKEIEDIVF